MSFHLCHIHDSRPVIFLRHFDGGRNVWYRLFAASVGERRIKKKRKRKKNAGKERSEEEIYSYARRDDVATREKWDRQKWLADRENESETNKIDRTRRESRARAAGALSWSSRAWEKASRFIDRERLQLAPRSPPGLPPFVPANGLRHCFIKTEPRLDTRARGPYVHCLWQVAFPPTRLRVAVELKRITLFASQLLERNSRARERDGSTGDE